ncbi:hypothetical protein ACFW91_28805 [Streptomyces asoensis]|uniref:hypothetical protein n=1 Tax=Streptomyces asoensis TaxID=249586 RepID=UPI00369258F0
MTDQMLTPAPPEPAPDCKICARLDELRALADAAGDKSGVADCNVLLRRHPGHKKLPPP